jgi:hypothetical protein
VSARPVRLIRSVAGSTPEAVGPGWKTTDSPAASSLEPLLRISDLAKVINCSRREVERMRSSGRLPRADLIVGKRSPRWRAPTVLNWLDSGGRPS